MIKLPLFKAARILEIILAAKALEDGVVFQNFDV